MTYRSPSPFARPAPGLRIREGAPPVHLPSEEEIAAFPRKAGELIERIRSAKSAALERGEFALDWVKGRHFLIAGGTGSGLGGCLAITLLDILGEAGSLTVVSRDLSHSVQHETGVAMRDRALKAGFGNRFHWINYGLALSGRKKSRIVDALAEAGADGVIYINCVAAAHSGILPGYPPVFVRDVDDQGLFEWQLLPLNDRQIKSTKFTMGDMAVQFPLEIEKAGIRIAASVFADWRGSLDHGSRYPSSVDYGRQGAYSTSLYLPKDIIQQAAAAAYGTGRIVIDVFFPVMKTRALSLVPGGMVMSCLFDTLMRKEGIRPLDTPELALGMLDRIGRAVAGECDNPFPRLDGHDAPLDPWFCEVVRRLNDDEHSDFYWKNWITCEPSADLS